MNFKRMIFSVGVVVLIGSVVRIETIFENSIATIILSMVLIFLMVAGCMDIYDTLLSKHPKARGQ